ncbi:MAG TPA: dihydrofolate reductase family protein [Solirubrobacterales bacterium]|nr:dihydrofolate reductase family protein [Solirubrobacterales bacterium]
MRRLVPDPGPTTVTEQLDAYRPWDDLPTARPRVALNFATTLDGRAAIEGRSGAIGSDTDTAMLVGLRQRFDAVMIGAGTMRVERYGRIIGDPAKRERREALGLPGDPLMVLVGSLDLPWDAPLFTDGGGEVLLITADGDGEPPATATPVEVVREPDGRVDLTAAMRRLREERGVRALLCEGGPHLHSQLQAAGLADELFLTIAPKLVGAGSSILEGALPEVAQLDLAWLLREDSELFARYLRRPA